MKISAQQQLIIRMSLPSSARAVIVGGGVIGASTAYNLSKLGWKNIILLEAQKVTSGTTWHAAGLVGTTRNTIAETKLSVIGSNMYKQLLSETGLDPGFKNTTSVNVARTPERMHLYHRVANKAKSFGLDANILSAEEVLEKYTSPASGISAVETSDLLGGIHLLQDGAGSPTDLTMSLLAGAKQRGVQVFENVRVSERASERKMATSTPNPPTTRLKLTQPKSIRLVRSFRSSFRCQISSRGKVMGIVRAAASRPPAARQ